MIISNHRQQTIAYYLRLQFCLLMFFVMGPATSATVEPGITLISENEVIYLGDSVIIDVEAVGLLEPLDVSSLFKYADLLRETTGTRIAVFEGRVVEVKLRRMEFVPKQEGPIIFGPLEGQSFRGTSVSNTLTIDVQPPADINWQPDNNDLIIRAKLTRGTAAMDKTDKEPLYVGQHLIATIDLKHRHPIIEEEVSLPTFDGFDVLPEFEERRTIEDENDENSWRVTTWRYHLFAQRSGTKKISGIQWSGTAVRSRTQRSAFKRQSNDINLNVEAASQLQQDEWWLPATAVSLSDEWSKDPRELSAGDEIIRTITLTAENVLASHLPTVVPLESRALSSDLIKQTRNQKLVGDTVEASATFTYRMIAQSPIPVFLDTVRVPWFHTEENRAREAIIPARRINVGLPDRADLLADIALRDNLWDRLTFKITRYGIDKTLWQFSLIILLLICCSFGLREWVLRRRENKLLVLGTKTSLLPEL